jgi:uncharacterized membrane protein
MNWILAGIRTLHILAGLFWVGGILYDTLIIVPHVARRREDDTVGRVLMGVERRFKKGSYVAAALLLLTGVSLLLILSPADGESPLPLIVKISSFSLLVFLTVFARFFLPDFRKEKSSASPSFRREFTLHWSQVVLGLSAFLIGIYLATTVR